jgi:L-ribulose-5-phosphate 3-epimerase
MKVGIINESLQMETKASLRKSKELGAHGVQLWVVNNDLEPQKLSRTGREDLVTYMASLGLERSALCGDLGMGFDNPATVDEAISRTKEMFDLCVDLKTPVLTTHIGTVPDDTESMGYANLLNAVGELARYAAERGCCFATETGPEPGAPLADFLRKINSPGAKVNFDPANLCMQGFDYLEDARALKDFIVHTHAKDGIYRSGVEKQEIREVALGKGDVDFPEYVSVLREIGYDGYLTIERECGDDPAKDVAEAVVFLKTLEGVEQ